jgi:hypothetical protein
MSSKPESRGIHVSSGPGIVAHLPNLTAYAVGDETLLNELLVRLNALADAPWHEIVRTLTAGITDADYDAHPHLACVSVEDDRVAALVFGDTVLSVTIDGTETTLNGSDSSTWIDVAIHGSVERIHAGHQSESTIVGVLRDGVIPAGGFLLDTSGPMPASGRWAEIAERRASAQAQAPDPTSNEDVDEPSDDTTESGPLTGMFARIDELHQVADRVTKAEADPRTEVHGDDTNEQPASSDVSLETANEIPPPVPATEPHAVPRPTATLARARPQLRGILCPAGHLTSVDDATCRTCGAQPETDTEIVNGDRPVLGLLTFDDGAVLAVDRPAAIGSNVPAGYEIDGEPATIVRLDDGLGGVSELQVEVRLVGWDLEIVDMNSENGTYTILRGERQTRTRLRSAQAVIMQPGMTVETGGRNFTYTVGQTPLP